MDPISRVEARIRRIQSLIGEPIRTKEEGETPVRQRAASGAQFAVGSAIFAAADDPPASPPRTTHHAPRTDFAPLIAEAAGATGLSPELIRAVMGAESAFQPTAVSPAGAMGLMQLMPGTARGLGVTDPFDPRQNVMAGAEYLRQQFSRFGTVEKALAAYNAGPGAVERFGGVPPYPETGEYVRRVMDALRAGSVLDEKR